MEVWQAAVVVCAGTQERAIGWGTWSNARNRGRDRISARKTLGLMDTDEFQSEIFQWSRKTTPEAPGGWTRLLPLGVIDARVSDDCQSAENKREALKIGGDVWLARWVTTCQGHG